MFGRLSQFLLLFISLFFLLSLSTTVRAQETRTIADKKFHLEENFWVDEEFNDQASILEIKYNSQAYTMFKKNNPDIQQFLSLGKNIKININGQNIVISNYDITNNTNDSDANSLTSDYSAYYALGIVIILAALFISALVIVIISRIHKNKRLKD